MEPEAALAPSLEAGIWVTDGAPSLSLQEKEGVLGHFPQEALGRSLYLIITHNDQ